MTVINKNATLFKKILFYRYVSVRMGNLQGFCTAAAASKSSP